MNIVFKIKTALILILVFALTTSGVSAQAVSGRYVESFPPSIRGQIGITVDVETGEIIYAKNPDHKAYPASTTKILTALLLAENTEPDEKIPYTQKAFEQPSYSLHKDYGPNSIDFELTAHEAMEAIIIYSANDVSTMVGEYLAGSKEEFSEMMNERIRKLGLQNTNFLNANGLHDDNHYTTGYELSVLTREAFQNDWVREVTKQPEVDLRTQNGEFPFENFKRHLENDGLILNKGGYTKESGRSLVALFERDGREIAGVVLNSTFVEGTWEGEEFNDMNRIMDWSFEEAHRTPLFQEGEKYDTYELEYREGAFWTIPDVLEIPLIPDESVHYYPNELNNREMTTTFDIEQDDAFDIDLDKPIGTLTVHQREKVDKVDVYTDLSEEDLPEENNNSSNIISIISLITVFVIISIFVIIKKRATPSKYRESKKLLEKDFWRVYS